MVGVRREDGLPIVATLGDVKPIASGAKRGSRGTRKDPPLLYFHSLLDIRLDKIHGNSALRKFGGCQWMAPNCELRMAPKCGNSGDASGWPRITAVKYAARLDLTAFPGHPNRQENRRSR